MVGQGVIKEGDGDMVMLGSLPTFVQSQGMLVEGLGRSFLPSLVSCKSPPTMSQPCTIYTNEGGTASTNLCR